jgi:hypothetical protein
LLFGGKIDETSISINARPNATNKQGNRREKFVCVEKPLLPITMFIMFHCRSFQSLFFRDENPVEK